MGGGASSAALDSAAASGGSGDAARAELVVRLMVRHQDDLFRYIFSLLPHVEDARDALQETCVALYRKFADYDDSKPFLAWAYAFAYLEVLKARERNCRGSRCLSDGLVQLLARDQQAQESELHTRLQALDACVRALPAADRELIQGRYLSTISSRASARAAARSFATSIASAARCSSASIGDWQRRCSRRRFGSAVTGQHPLDRLAAAHAGANAQ
jgi:RNA polymerase sigma-70 factor (ECF subfamily)